MTDISTAIKALKESNIEAIEINNMLVIPVTDPKEIYPTVDKVTRIFKEIDFRKSWLIDPYYDSRHDSLIAEMYPNA